MSSIPILVREHAGASRRSETVSVGVSLPQGLSSASDSWAVQTPSGELLPCQAVPLADWTDGSTKWLTATFAATVAGHETAKYLLIRNPLRRANQSGRLRVTDRADSLEVDTGRALFVLPRRGERLIAQVRSDQPLLTKDGVKAALVDRHGRSSRLVIDGVELVERGPVRCRVAFSGCIPRSGLRVFGQCTFNADSPGVTVELTLHNPSRARHPRGLWDLGDPGSVLFRSFSLSAQLGGNKSPRIGWREQVAGPWREQAGGDLAIEQQSSGGENYASRNHVSRRGHVPERICGYRVRSAGGEQHGQRAEPTCVVQVGDRWLGTAVAEFWQQFPTALQVDGNTMQIGLFPEMVDDLHELQGGEQKSVRIGLAMGSSPQPDASSLLAVLAPLEAFCETAWTAASGAVWRLPRSLGSLRQEWRTVAAQSAEGPSSFFAKRETADEYGWRNFGDLWADHEQAYYNGPRPIVSHYNNQYDALEGFLLCYMLTGDRRWWELADPLARHVIDIDIYHTTQDRAAYNGGLFWHTNHYVDAATSTHRAYSRVNHPAGGGGPGNEHNYTSGLLLYYHLTGNRQARDAVVSLAEWVLHMDDGRKHLLGLLYEAPTGFASATAQTCYHGPGRGAGNSINALLDGWQATGCREFLVKAEELVRRTIHPQDDIAALDLGNAELRWSYTVFLQSLVRMLAQAQELGLETDLIDYLRSSLLHYARWMAMHETFYLDCPEKLEFPTETWAAQEIRKANVLTAAAIYVDPCEGDVFRARAQDFYDRAWSSLMGFPTWHYTRPTVLALQLGLGAACLAEARPVATAPRSSAPDVSPVPRGRFVSQKEAVRRGLRSPADLLAMVVRLGRVWRWSEVWRASWPAQRVRRMWGQFVG